MSDLSLLFGIQGKPWIASVNVRQRCLDVVKGGLSFTEEFDELRRLSLRQAALRKAYMNV